MSDQGSEIGELATEQLRAYNAHDLDAFCACYHAQVRVLDADGGEQLRGLAAFRERYRPKFEAGGFGATVDARLDLAPHCVERETWWLAHAGTGERVSGTLLVRYTAKDGLIGTVTFLRGP